MHIYLLCSLYNYYNTSFFLYNNYCAFSIILNAQYLVFLVISDSSVQDYNIVQFGWHSRSLWCQFRKTCIMYLYFCDTVVVCAKLQENNITVFQYNSNIEGSVLNISCLEDYSLPEGEVKSVCGSDGSWSPDPNNYECTLSSMYIWLTIIHESTYLPFFNSIHL